MKTPVLFWTATVMLGIIVANGIINGFTLITSVGSVIIAIMLMAAATRGAWRGE